MTDLKTTDYESAIKEIKAAILKSRYTAARLANRELLLLYFKVGQYVSNNSREGFWGTGAITEISKRLTQELPGLRGFSEGNIKKMRLFYEAWKDVFSNRSPLTNEFSEDSSNSANRSLPTNEFPKDFELRIVTDAEITLDEFFAVSFTNHILIVMSEKSLKGRIFYISRCAAEFWTAEKLQYHLREKLFEKQTLPITSNFGVAISDKNLRASALRAFKDEYLLDFVNIEDPDEFDERELESEIILNIKKFILALGGDFAFIGNQYKVVVSEKEYFIDLLFFNRRLQCLVAIELKRGEFKPEYAGKLNFYLSALDEYVRLPNENPSIGIILCKSKDKKTVEFSFRDTAKPMGVASFKTSNELPEEYRNILPSAEELMRHL
ncbi:MAG: PDDEXK nuclease domain-containing protein [Treponema sp.]|uniref:PDDEXK nuclease domain-containing protein n=1 Tax=Treponema sp. TaxID=166 RepID=UPI002A90A74D|nr:PDDEXK nuclease domain-containing protein [Treponema sp.]MDY6398354.1 PDDEXK nuclease domain-containing protein [Treponema sp.]